MFPMPNNREPPRMSELAPTVLVVDDEVQIRRFLRAGLELDGFVVQDAETGADALKSGVEGRRVPRATSVPTQFDRSA